MIDNNDEIKDEGFDNTLDNPILQAFFALDEATPGDEGVDYRRLYYDLFRGISLIIEHTTTYEQTIEALKVLQCKAEDFYISQE